MLLKKIVLMVAPLVCALSLASAQTTTTYSSSSASESNMSVADSVYNEAVAAYRSRDLKTAERLFTKALKAKPTLWQAYINRGQVFLLQTQIDKALDDFKNAKTLLPKSAAIRYDIGIIEANSKQIQPAIESFSEALALDTLYAKAYSNRAELYRLQKNKAAAQRDIDRSKALDKTVLLAYSTQGQLYIDGKKYKEAVLQFDTVCAAQPTQMQPYMLRGQAFFALEKYKDAAADFSKVVFLVPNYAPAYIERGKARIALGQEEEACDDFARAAGLQHPDAGEYMRDFCNN